MHFSQKDEPKVSERDLNSANEGEIIEGLMQTHDLTLSNLRSRLTKVQVILTAHVGLIIICVIVYSRIL